MLSGSNMEGLALLSNTKEGVGGKTWKPSAARTKASDVKDNGALTNKPRHTRKMCFKLHGKEAVLNLNWWVSEYEDSR